MNTFQVSPGVRKAIYMVAALCMSAAAALGFIDANTAGDFLSGFAPVLEGSAGLLSIFSLIMATLKTHADSDVSRFDVEKEVAERMEAYASTLHDQMEAIAKNAASETLQNIDPEKFLPADYSPRHELAVNNMLEYYKTHGNN